MKPSQSSPGSAAASRSRSGPSANWKRNSSSSAKKRSALALSFERRSTSRSFQRTIHARGGRAHARPVASRVDVRAQVEALQGLLARGSRGSLERDAAAGQDGHAVGDAELAAEAVGGDHRAPPPALKPCRYSSSHLCPRWSRPANGSSSSSTRGSRSTRAPARGAGASRRERAHARTGLARRDLRRAPPDRLASARRPAKSSQKREVLARGEVLVDVRAVRDDPDQPAHARPARAGRAPRSDRARPWGAPGWPGAEQRGLAGAVVTEHAGPVPAGTSRVTPRSARAPVELREPAASESSEPRVRSRPRRGHAGISPEEATAAGALSDLGPVRSPRTGGSRRAWREAARCAPRSADESRTGSASERPLSGLTMNRCAVAGLASIGTTPARLLELPSADASPSGLPRELRPGGVGLVLARAGDRELDEHGGDGRQDDREEQGERVRARPPRRRAATPPKIMAHWAMWASIEIAPARVAAMVEIRVSRFWTWDSSWARTPSSSSSSRIRRMPFRHRDRRVLRDCARSRRRSGLSDGMR